MIYLMIAANIILLVAGQALWKFGMNKVQLQLSFNGIIKILFNPYIFSGIVIYGIATVIWLYILSKADLSKVYPLQSLCYVVAAIVAIVLFKEQIPVTRWFGMGLILAGAYFVAMK